MKKLMIVLLCLSLVFALSACGKNKKDSETPTSSADLTPVPPPASDSDLTPVELPASDSDLIPVELPASGSDLVPEQTAGLPTPTEDGFPIIVPLGESYSIDLNGDGAMEEICVSLYSDENNFDKVKVTLNGEDVSNALYDNFWLDCPDDSCWCITDVYSVDTLLEIAVQDWGPSDDLHTMFLRYDGSEVYPFGDVPGMIRIGERDGNISFEKDGFVHTDSYRLSVLQTWFTSVDYEIGNAEWLTLVPQEIYEPNTLRSVTVKTPLLAYDGKDGESFPIEAGVEMTIEATDNCEWIRCSSETEDWVLWFHLNPEYGTEIETPDGFISTWEALDGLLFAD